MREILFRGKRIATHNWVEGSLLNYGDGDYDICSESGVQGELDKYAVYPKTIGQFTELTDKNGIKVFDGDILKFTDLNAEYEWIGRVEFGNPNEEYNWGFQLVFISGEKPNTDILLWFDMEETGAYSEVIGNIHDNPELLRSE